MPMSTASSTRTPCVSVFTRGAGSSGRARRGTARGMATSGSGGDLFRVIVRDRDWLLLFRAHIRGNSNNSVFRVQVRGICGYSSAEPPAPVARPAMLNEAQQEGINASDHPVVSSSGTHAGEFRLSYAGAIP